MNMQGRWVGLTLGVVALTVCVSAVRAAKTNQSADETNYVAALQEVEAEAVDTDQNTMVQETEWKKPIPVTFNIDYTIASDYIFRGINFSEYRRKWGQAKNEGRERLNHQLSTGVEGDLGPYGRVGGTIWFEWFAGQNYLTPDDGHNNLQEVDYTVYYGYNIEPIGVDAEVGFIWYTFPRGQDDWKSTQEIYLNTSFDESVWMRALGLNMKKSFFNPYLFQAWDLDLARGGYYGEFGIAPEFALAEYGCSQMPVLKDLTFTPSYAMGWDHNWLNKMTLDPSAWAGNEGRGYASNTSHLMFARFGGDLTYDLKGAFKIPDKYCGAMYVKGFMYYSQGIAEHFLNDEFWGGMSVGYEW